VKCAIALAAEDLGRVGLESRVDQGVAGQIAVDRRGRSDLQRNRKMRNRRTKTQRDFVLSVTGMNNALGLQPKGVGVCQGR
jgi:hypothetical protein